MAFIRLLCIVKYVGETKTENRHLQFPVFTVKEVDEYENLPIYCHFSVVSFCCTGSLWLQFCRRLHDIVTDTPEQGNCSG